MIDTSRLDGESQRAAVLAAFAAQGAPPDEVMADLVALAAERTFSSRLGLRGAALREGALDFVREAAGTTRLAVVTRARRADADTLLRLAQLDAFFNVIVTADDVLDAKPGPEGYRIALERLAKMRPVDPRSAIAIEDGGPGIRAARAVGVRCIAVGPLPAHVAIEADAYVPSLESQTVRSLDQLSRPGQERVQ